MGKIVIIRTFTGLTSVTLSFVRDFAGSPDYS